MKTLKYFLSLFLMLTMSLISISQEENTDAVYNKLTREYVLHPDGTIDFHLKKELKLLTYFSFHRLFGETFIIYDPSSQELKINDSYTVMADGKKVKSPANAFNEVLPGFAANIPAYNRLREMVVTHTGLENGATIFFDYTITSQPGQVPYLMGNEAIGEIVPVKEMAVIVRVPKDVPLRHKMLNLRTAPEIRNEGQETVYTWTFRGVKANSQESFQDPSLMPRLLFSTARDLQQACFKFVDQAAFRDETGPELAKRAEAALSGKNDDLQKILALQDIVVNEVKLADVPFQYTSFAVRTSGQAWLSANATPLEKAVMLSDMLIKANINAVPVALVPKSQYDATLGDLLSFEQFLVQVNPRETGRFYLSPVRKNEQNLILSLQDYMVVPLDGAMETIRPYTEEGAKSSGISLEGSLSLEDTAMLTGMLNIELEGLKNPYFKLTGNPDAVKSQLSGGLGQSAVKSHEITSLKQDLCEADLAVEKKKPLENFGELYFLTLPALSSGIGQYHLETMSDARESMLKLPAPVDEEYEFTVTLPRDWRMLNPETDLKIENEAGALYIEVAQKKDKAVIKKSLEIHPLVPAEHYPGLMELVRTFSDEKYSRLVLEAGE